MISQILYNKRIVISAGASGIGWATAKICAQKGAYVYLCDINNTQLKKIQRHHLYNKKIFSHKADASNEKEVINFFVQIKKKFKKIDCLINNVGIAGPTGTIEKIKSEEWKKTLEVNVLSHFYFTKQAIPLIKKSSDGSIINISSTAGIMGFPLRSPYVASKWAIIGMTKTLAMELGKFKIRVNAICPGLIKGNRMKRVIKAKSEFLNINQKTLEKDFISMSSIKKWITENDIGNLCSFLISKESKSVSGQIISVDANTERMN